MKQIWIRTLSQLGICIFLNKITEFFFYRNVVIPYHSNKNILIDSTDDRLGLASLRTAFTTSI